MKKEYYQLRKLFPNIIAKHDYHKFYLEVQQWERKLSLLTKIFNETNDDIIKFYSNKTVNRDYKLISHLTQTLMIFTFSTCEVERLFPQSQSYKES